jgi:hypothetical protein
VSNLSFFSRALLTFLLDTLIRKDKPADDSEAVGDPYKTLFISRLVIGITLDDINFR